MTVTPAVPVFPLVCAVMVAVPAATNVTSPVLDTVAMAVALELHAKVAVTTVPAVFLAVAVSCCAGAPATPVIEVGETVTVAGVTSGGGGGGGGGGVGAAATLPADVASGPWRAVTVNAPAASAVTNAMPCTSGATFAMAGLSTLHTTPVLICTPSTMSRQSTFVPMPILVNG